MNNQTSSKRPGKKSSQKRSQRKNNNRQSGRVARFLIFFRRLLLCTILLSILLVLCFRWFPPPTSAFMIEAYFSRLFNSENSNHINYKWVNWNEISPSVPLAMMASEDQLFPEHWGFDLKAINQSIANRKDGEIPKGASSITQQVAKNLFLWDERNYFRKGLEAYFTVLIEILWPKKRILEVYMNIAEFGDGIYGVKAASETYWGKTPSNLTQREAALLASVLPSPKRYKVKKPSYHVLERARWIERQIYQLGGIRFLEKVSGEYYRHTPQRLKKL